MNLSKCPSVFFKSIISIISIISISYSFSSYGSLNKAFEQYKLGKYAQAIESANQSTPKTQKDKNAIIYIKAQSYKAQQEYEKSIIQYLLLIKNNPSKKNLSFDIAQSYYALNNLKKSLKYFKHSAKLNYKKYQSYYYIAYVYSLFEQYSKSINYYEKILKAKQVDKNLKQSSAFQYNEVRYYLLKKTKDKNIKFIIKTKILPSLKKSISISKHSKIVPDIQSRIDSLVKEFKLDPNTMKNGKKISSKRIHLNLSQTFGYDTNVTNQNDSTISTTATNNDSIQSITNLDLNYLLSFKQRYLITPGFSFYNLYYVDQKNSNVYKNNSSTISAYINSSKEHTLFNKQASTILNFKYDYLKRDLNGTKKNIFQARSQMITFGEKFNLFSKGTSSIKYRFKNYTGYLKTINTRTHSLIIDQMISFKNKKLLMIFTEIDFISYYNDTISSVNSYLIRLDYIYNLGKLNIDMALSVNLTDTKKQFKTKGLESLIMPSIKITRNISKKFTCSLSHEYSKNNSKDKNFKYHKNITNFEFNLSF